MKKVLIAALTLFAACSQRAVSTDPGEDLPGVPKEIDPTLAVSTPNGGIGHACPVDGYIYTAHHVVYNEATGEHLNVTWSDGYGNSGYASVAAEHPALDLVVLVVDETSPLPGNMLSYEANVKVGERVYWFEYDFRTRANVLRARRRFANVLRVVAQHVIYDDVPRPGASGTCLINSEGKVIGIVNAMWDTDDKLGAGVAVKIP